MAKERGDIKYFFYVETQHFASRGGKRSADNISAVINAGDAKYCVSTWELFWN